MKSQCVAARGLLLFLTPYCMAQRPSVPEQKSSITTLHAATRLIVLDVVVSDKQGNPVHSLSKGDFAWS